MENPFVESCSEYEPSESSDEEDFYDSGSLSELQTIDISDIPDIHLCERGTEHWFNTEPKKVVLSEQHQVFPGQDHETIWSIRNSIDYIRVVGDASNTFTSIWEVFSFNKMDSFPFILKPSKLNEI